MIDMVMKTLIDIGPADREIGFKVSQLESRILVTADRRSEGVALLDVILGEIKGLLRGCDRMQRDGQAFLRQSLINAPIAPPSAPSRLLTGCPAGRFRCRVRSLRRRKWSR